MEVSISIRAGGELRQFGSQDLLLLADRFEIGQVHRILAQVGEAVSAWPDFAVQARVSAEAAERIRKHQVRI